MDTKNACVAIVMLAGLCRICPGALVGDVELGGRYVDPIHGFSLRAPLGTERTRDPSPSRLVTWSRREEKTNAVVWKLSVLRAVESSKTVEIEPYSRALAKKLRSEENFKIDSVEIKTFAGRPAIDLRGVTGGAVRLWRRQVWVLARAGEFLVFIITGPVDAARQLGAICDKVLATLELTDPKAGQAQRLKSLENGKRLLAGLTDERMAAAIISQPQWYLLKLKGKDVGFMRTMESIAKRDGVMGYEVITWVMFQQPKAQQRFGRRVMFTTADRQLERWNESLQTGKGKTARRLSEEGIKQAEMIVCYISRGGAKLQTRKKMLEPDAIRAVYLPRAMGAMLWRLVDLTTPMTYAFATYNSSANSFDMRTFAVLGPERIDLLSRTLEAVRVTDRMAADAPTATLWVNGDGVLLRMKTSDGLLMEHSTRAAVLRRFPDARQQIDSSDRRRPGKLR